MAAAVAEKPKFSIREFEEVAKPGRYDAEVRALVDADRSNGRHNLIDILVPTREKADRGRYAGQETDAVGKYVRAFQYSAKNAKDDQAPNGFTARLEGQEDQGDGTTLLSFLLTERIIRKSKDAESELDIPEES